MLRNKKDSLRDIPVDVRHSLQFLDTLLDDLDDTKTGTLASTLRGIKTVPADARKSLEILDSVLGEYEFDSEEIRRSESADNLRKPQKDVNEEVNKSLEVLDRVLDEFQNEGGQHKFDGKHVNNIRAPMRRPKHEDIRRSLEVLDSVLAEFDDCLESWDPIVPERNLSGDESHRIRKNKEYSIVSSDDASLNSFSYDSQITDGSTSHDSGVSFQEQVKVTSPPPVPKRNVSTKLSDRSSGLFTFPSAPDDQSFNSLPPDFATQDNATRVSKNDAISTLSAKDDDEVFQRDHNNASVKSHYCSKCGNLIDTKGDAMENKAGKENVSRSPFSEKRKMFEDRINESRISVSPLLERSFVGSSFKVKAVNRTKDCESEPSSLILYKTNDCSASDSSQSSFASKFSPKATKVAPPTVQGLLSLPTAFHHPPNCNCKERIRQLQVKFAETHRLLKANKIKGLDAKPPSFVPPPPPMDVVIKNTANEFLSPDKRLLNGSSAVSDSNSFSASNGSLNSDSLNSEVSDVSHPSPVLDTDKNSDTNSDEQKLCSRCSNSDSLPISETIEDLPKLLPTDALKRPHLGLSYCMEDDFCPGVKEILQTSIPRNGLPLSKNKLSPSLSTFSLSDSSLGYVSSQSDLELNSPFKSDKVPVSNMKFSTLPEGMDLHSLPSYYGQDEATESGPHSKSSTIYRDRNFNHTTELHLRSSSAPPLPEEEKPKKKHFRAFSKKEKKDKKKNDDNISVTSYLSLDDGVILKTIDGDTNNRNAADSKETGVEKRRWSGFRSLLGKR